MSASTDAIVTPAVAASANGSPQIMSVVLWCLGIVVVITLSVACIAGTKRVLARRAKARANARPLDDDPQQKTKRRPKRTLSALLARGKRSVTRPGVPRPYKSLSQKPRAQAEVVEIV